MRDLQPEDPSTNEHTTPNVDLTPTLNREQRRAAKKGKPGSRRGAEQHHGDSGPPRGARSGGFVAKNLPRRTGG